MSWNFVICCILVQLFFVDSIEVNEDVIEDIPNISENFNNQDNLVNETTTIEESSEINSTEIVSNNETIVANLTMSGYNDDKDLKNVAKQIDDRETFKKEGSIAVLQKEDDKNQENSTVVPVKLEKPVEKYFADENDSFEKEASRKIIQKEDNNITESSSEPIKYKKLSFPVKTYSTEIKPQAFSYSSNTQSIKKGPILQPTVFNKHISKPIFIPSPEVKLSNFEVEEISSAYTGNSGKEVKEYSTEIRSQGFSKSSNLQNPKDKLLSVSMGSVSKLSVPEKGYSTEIKPKILSQSHKPQNNNDRFIPVHTVFGNDFSQPIFIPSPEVSVNNFGSAVLLDKDSFQPLRYPFLSLNKKELLTPTRRVSVDYQEKKRPKDTENGGSNYSGKPQVFKGDVIKEIRPITQVDQMKRRNEQGYWVVLDNSKEKLKPQNKIINAEHHELFYDQIQDDYRLSDVKPIQEEIRSDHPYPFEYVKDDDFSNWLHSSPPPLEGAEYEDHSYDDIPPTPPSPSRPHSLANTHPDWESKFTRGKEIVKPSPLRSILHVLGTIVPIGLLLSALTPNVVMINPNATSTFKQTPGDLNLFRGRHRSLKEDETIDKTNLENVIRKLAGVKVQKPSIDSTCDKKQICEYLALHGAALDDLQKTIKNILDRSQALKSEVNVSMDELFAAAREDSCASLLVCKETAAESTID